MAAVLSQGHRPLAATLQIKVGSLEEEALWYERLLGRQADLRPNADLHEWELFPDFWIQVTEMQVAGKAGRLRLGVSDVVQARRAIIDDLGAEVSEMATLPSVVAYCDFNDPWGNPLGLFQDLKWYLETG